MYEPFVINPLGPHFVHVFLALVVSCLLIILGWLTTRNLSLIPTAIQNVMETYVEGMTDFMAGTIPGDVRPHVPLIATLFLFILFSNWIGLVPGFIAPTSNWNTTIAPAIVVFFYYHYWGIKKHGVKNYLKHFAGPVWWLAPLIFILETIGHLARVLSLSIRLFGNIMGEETLLFILFTLVPFLLPIPLMFLSLFFGLVQALVFTLLSIVYIALAVEEHEEH